VTRVLLFLAFAALASPLVALADGADSLPSPDRAYVNAVLDGLVQSGVLTADQADEIKAAATEAAAGAEDNTRALAASEPKPKPKWYDTMKVSGYVQGRWEYSPDAQPGDASNTFLVRRARTKFGANPDDRTEIEIQADWGESSASIKDAWLQRDLTAAGDWRVRLGLQKVPFGFETPQSSSVRLPLERNWLARRTIAGERDTGLVLFYTTPEDHELFGYAKKREYGTGDYGNIALGVFNGQGADEGLDLNSNKHFTVRLCKPFAIGGSTASDGPGRYAEVGASYYGGRYYSDSLGVNVDDELVGVHAYVAPKPLGLQAEYYDGKTEGDDLRGWYGMALFRPSDAGCLFVRYDDYQGRRKGKGADPYDRHRTSIGYAHELDANTRLTAEYDIQRNEAKARDEDLFGLQLMTRY